MVPRINAPLWMRFFCILYFGGFSMNDYFVADSVDDVISLKDFLANYCDLNVFGDDVKLAHKELKLFNFPNVVAVGFSNVQTDDIKTGNIILVRDSYRNIAPYRNPVRIEEEKKVRERKGEFYDKH